MNYPPSLYQLEPNGCKQEKGRWEAAAAGPELRQHPRFILPHVTFVACSCVLYFFFTQGVSQIVLAVGLFTNLSHVPSGSSTTKSIQPVTNTG
jgi:hypothetical protein